MNFSIHSIIALHHFTQVDFLFRLSALIHALLKSVEATLINPKKNNNPLCAGYRPEYKIQHFSMPLP